MNPYIENIIDQPEALRRAVRSFSTEGLDGLRAGILGGRFDRFLLTGMGASLSAAYPAVLTLAELPVPVQMVNSSELVHYLGGLISERTFLWMNSQSGRSAELVHLLATTASHPPACVLACVNDLESPLASGSDHCLPIHAGPEATVSTKTYLNTMAVNLMAAAVLTGSNLDNLRSDLLRTADSIEVYLAGLEDRVSALDELLEAVSRLMLLGRGASMSTVWNGSLINKEAAKFALEGMHAAEFRHGPLELVEPGFAALILSGSSQTSALNHGLALEINGLGGRAIWVDSEVDSELETFLMPEAYGLARPLAEILPMQLLTLVLAKRNGFEPGVFRTVKKITEIE